MKGHICAAMLTLTLALPAGFVFAESAQPEQTQPESCKEDVKKFCPKVVSSEIIKCLNEHKKELTKPCKADLEKWMKQKLKEQEPKVPSPLGK